MRDLLAKPKASRPRLRKAARATPTAAERFLDTAERLFADLGYQGASVRSIAAAAQVNLGALHYYWGSKAALYKAVIARRLEPMNNERLRLFDLCEATAEGERPDLRAVLTAFVGPAMRMGDAAPEAAEITRRLYHRMVSDPSPDAQELTAAIYGDVSARFIALLRRCCPHLAPEEFFWRVQTAYGAVRFSQAGTPWIVHIAQGGFRGDDPDEGTRHIVEALQAGLMAPSIVK